MDKVLEQIFDSMLLYFKLPSFLIFRIPLINKTNNLLTIKVDLL